MFKALKLCASHNLFRASLASLVSMVKRAGWENFERPLQRSARPHHRELNCWMRMSIGFYNLLEEDLIQRSIYVINNIDEYYVICIFA